MITEGAAEGNADSTAEAFFRTKLRFEIDVMDVADAPRGTFVLVDSRRQSSWDHGHIPGALHIPTADIPSSAPEIIPSGTSVVVYSWGPGCNGSTLAALAFAKMGYPVRELIGGIEYWIRNGLPVETPHRIGTAKPDGLVTAAHTGDGRQPRLLPEKDCPPAVHGPPLEPGWDGFVELKHIPT